MTTQASLTNLVSKLRIKTLPVARRFGNPEGPVGRIKSMRQTVTGLVKYERLELNFFRADEARGYAERLISEAIRHGDCHRPTMNLAKFWLQDPALVPKLFKVLVPRYQNWPPGLSYSRMLRAPSNIKDHNDNYEMGYQYAVLELRGNPYPSLSGPMRAKPHSGLIHNVLLEEARKEYFNVPEPETCHLENVTTEDIEELSGELTRNVAKSDQVDEKK